MVFNSISFVIIYPFLFLLYYIIPVRNKGYRNLYLLIVSYMLYMGWKPAYALILLFVTLVTYCGGVIIDRLNKKENIRFKRKTLLAVMSVLCAGPLVFFKYFDFINNSCSSLLTTFGLSYHMDGLELVVPVGISFFTFQALGYLFDVYYRRIEHEGNFVSYALFVSFFPAIVSGPINKASALLPQIKNIRPYFDYHKAVEGLKFILWGMFMKVVVADRIALCINPVFEDNGESGGISYVMAAVLYSIQIYADFAGYSYMAIGVGKTLGFELAENFRRPYFAVSVTDFWRRWHISLSVWLRDYVYIPCGGNRCGRIRNYCNILFTFLVSGIWHGANWTFVLWGALHGVFLVAEKILRLQKCEYGGTAKAVRVLFTFVLVSFAWIFFRMPSISDAVNFICGIFDFSAPLALTAAPKDYIYAAAGIMILLFKDVTDEFYPDKLRFTNSRFSVIRWCSYVMLMLCVLFLGVLNSRFFIYANF